MEFPKPPSFYRETNVNQNANDEKSELAFGDDPVQMSLPSLLKTFQSPQNYQLSDAATNEPDVGNKNNYNVFDSLSQNKNMTPIKTAVPFKHEVLENDGIVKPEKKKQDDADNDYAMIENENEGILKNAMNEQLKSEQKKVIIDLSESKKEEKVGIALSQREIWINRIKQKVKENKIDSDINYLMIHYKINFNHSLDDYIDKVIADNHVEYKEETIMKLVDLFNEFSRKKNTKLMAAMEKEEYAESTISEHSGPTQSPPSYSKQSENKHSQQSAFSNYQNEQPQINKQHKVISPQHSVNTSSPKMIKKGINFEKEFKRFGLKIKNNKLVTTKGAKFDIFKTRHFRTTCIRGYEWKAINQDLTNLIFEQKALKELAAMKMLKHIPNKNMLSAAGTFTDLYEYYDEEKIKVGFKCGCTSHISPDAKQLKIEKGTETFLLSEKCDLTKEIAIIFEKLFLSKEAHVRYIEIEQNILEKKVKSLDFNLTRVRNEKMIDFLSLHRTLRRYPMIILLLNKCNLEGAVSTYDPKKQTRGSENRSAYWPELERKIIYIDDGPREWLYNINKWQGNVVTMVKAVCSLNAALKKTEDIEVRSKLQYLRSMKKQNNTY